MQIIKRDNAWDGLFTGANCLKDLKPIQVTLLNQQNHEEQEKSVSRRQKVFRYCV